MGKIKKLKDVELVGGTEQSDVYPITSTKAIYDENNKRLDSIISELQKSADSSLETENKTIVGSINELKRLQDKGYLFKDVATPTTDPGTPKAKVFYIANGKGTYTNFGGIEVTEDDVVVLYYDTEWHKVATGIASNEKLAELEKKVSKKVAINETHVGKTYYTFSGKLYAGEMYYFFNEGDYISALYDGDGTEMLTGIAIGKLYRITPNHDCNEIRIYGGNDTVPTNFRFSIFSPKELVEKEEFDNVTKITSIDPLNRYIKELYCPLGTTIKTIEFTGSTTAVRFILDGTNSSVEVSNKTHDIVVPFNIGSSRCYIVLSDAIVGTDNSNTLLFTDNPVKVNSKEIENLVLINNYLSCITNIKDSVRSSDFYNGVYYLAGQWRFGIGENNSNRFLSVPLIGGEDIYIEKTIDAANAIAILTNDEPIYGGVANGTVIELSNLITNIRNTSNYKYLFLSDTTPTEKVVYNSILINDTEMLSDRLHKDFKDATCHKIYAKVDGMKLVKGGFNAYRSPKAFAVNGLDMTKRYRMKILFSQPYTFTRNAAVHVGCVGGNETVMVINAGTYTTIEFSFIPISRWQYQANVIYFNVYCYEDDIPTSLTYSMEVDEIVYSSDYSDEYSISVEDVLVEEKKVYYTNSLLNVMLNTSKDHLYRLNISQSRSFGDNMALMIKSSDGTDKRSIGFANPDIVVAGDGGFDYTFKCPFDNAVLEIATVGLNTESFKDSPYVNVRLYSRTSKKDVEIKNTSIQTAICIGKSARSISKAKGDIAKMKGAMSSINYDVCIIGAGSAGINAAYPLVKAGKNVCIVDKNKEIGGSMAQAYINCCAATPDSPFFREYVHEMLVEGTAKYVDAQYHPLTETSEYLSYTKSLLRSEFTGEGNDENGLDKGLCITFDIDAYVNKMHEKLIDATFLTGCSFKSCVFQNKKVSSIVVTDENDNDISINADVFIDCSADDVLVRSINTEEGVGYFVGADKKDRFQNRWGFIEPHGATQNARNAINAPTLMFRTRQGLEDLSGIAIPDGWTPYITPYYYGDAGDNFGYFNSSSMISDKSGVTGIDVIDNGEQYAVDKMKPLVLPYWKYAKENNSQKPYLLKYGINTQCYVSIAPMLGIRETYRAACERMLSENDICTLIRISDLEVDNVYDLPIGIANHPVDFHGDSYGIDVDAINANRRPYFIRYGSLVPINTDNVLVASRGAGFTHIAAASVRLNKTIMELGYAAGCAALYMQSNKTSSSDVDKAILKNMTEIESLTKEIIEMVA